jgi:hypothetical protein
MSYFDAEAGADLRETFDHVVAGWPDVSSKTMFGCPSYQAEGTLFAVLVTGGVALTRLPADERATVEREFETGPFQAGDRTVTKWVQVAVDDPETLDALVPYVRASYETALAEGSA